MVRLLDVLIVRGLVVGSVAITTVSLVMASVRLYSDRLVRG